MDPCTRKRMQKEIPNKTHYLSCRDKGVYIRWIRRRRDCVGGGKKGIKQVENDKIESYDRTAQSSNPCLPIAPHHSRAIVLLYGEIVLDASRKLQVCLRAHSPLAA
jgi:hypothetical protein